MINAISPIEIRSRRGPVSSTTAGSCIGRALDSNGATLANCIGTSTGMGAWGGVGAGCGMACAGAKRGATASFGADRTTGTGALCTGRAGGNLMVTDGPTAAVCTGGAGAGLGPEFGCSTFATRVVAAGARSGAAFGDAAAETATASTFTGAGSGERAGASDRRPTRRH